MVDIVKIDLQCFISTPGCVLVADRPDVTYQVDYHLSSSVGLI